MLSGTTKDFDMTMRFCAAFLFSLLLVPSAHAAKCGGDFNGFLAQMVRDAQAQGVRPDVAQNAFAGLSVDPNVLAFDRRQRGTFRKTFEEYVATRVGASASSAAATRWGATLASSAASRSSSACRRS